MTKRSSVLDSVFGCVISAACLEKLLVCSSLLLLNVQPVARVLAVQCVLLVERLLAVTTMLAELEGQGGEERKRIMLGNGGCGDMCSSSWFGCTVSLIGLRRFLLLVRKPSNALF